MCILQADWLGWNFRLRYVDPNVLEANGIDSKIYKGYAFGMGVERITNLKYQVKDLRLFSENDVRFLDEFTAAN